MIRWTQGERHGLIWAHGLAVVDSSVTHDVAVQLWRDFAVGGQLADFLKLLSAHTKSDLLALPDFAIALRTSADSWQLAARGRLEVQVDDEVIRGAGVSTWAERFIARGRSVRLGAASDADASAWPILAGVVPASAVTWLDGTEPAGFVASASAEVRSERSEVPGRGEPDARVGDDPVVDADQDLDEDAVAEFGSEAIDDSGEQPSGAGNREADDEASGAEEPDAEDEDPSDDQPDNADPEAEDEPNVKDEDEAPSEENSDDENADSAPGDEATLAPDEPVPVDQPDPADEGVSAVSVFGPPSTSGRFARQYGDTQLVSVEDAAVREEAAPLFISSVPGAVPASVAPVPLPVSGSGVPPRPEPVGAIDGDHDGCTVLAGSVPASEASPALPAPDPIDLPPGTPTVLGILCANGHANPPHRGCCSTCGLDIEGEATRLARPSLGTLALPNGERIELTGPVVVGRNPRVDRVQGSVLPQLVPLSQGHISGTHLELRLEDWNVLAVDLHSTNGTFLRRKGEAPVRLGERPELLIEGDVLDLGHGVQLVLEHLR